MNQKIFPHLLQVDKLHALQPGGEEGTQAKCTAVAVGQHVSQDGVVGKHPVNQRGALPVLPHHKSGNQFLGNNSSGVINTYYLTQ